MSSYYRLGRTLAVLFSLVMSAQSSAAQVPVDLAKIRGSMRVPTAAIVVKAPDGAVREVRPEATLITLKPGEYAVAKTAERAIEVAAPASGAGSGQGVGYQLPVTLATVTADGNQLALGIVVRTGSGLMPRADPSQYQGRIFVGLINTLDPLTTIKLPAPVQVTVTGPVESIKPEQQQFEATNLFVPIELTARTPADPVKLRVSMGVALSETEVPVSVFNPTVSVLTSMPSLDGFGFETVDVTVQAKGISKLEGMAVTLFLQGGGGSFTPSSNLVLDANGRATARLRSSGVSPNVVVAATLGNGVIAQAPPIAYVWPIAWFVFAIGGGLAGGIVKQLTGKPRRWLAALVVSVVVGFVAAGLYMLGVSTIPAIPVGIGGQLVVAMIAAVAALAGVSVLPVPRGR